ncbi:unnamed protein product [Meloidogyne enterolobii]|uniref:Uncharacterized protein n=1 Tax=Meloidogyne enterolobii TaxID=390850 RepID=A0ACB0ZPP5_MELEN
MYLPNLFSNLPYTARAFVFIFSKFTHIFLAYLNSFNLTFGVPFCSFDCVPFLLVFLTGSLWFNLESKYI